MNQHDDPTISVFNCFGLAWVANYSGRNMHLFKQQDVLKALHRCQIQCWHINDLCSVLAYKTANSYMVKLNNSNSKGWKVM